MVKPYMCFQSQGRVKKEPAAVARIACLVAEIFNADFLHLPTECDLPQGQCQQYEHEHVRHS